MYFKPRLIKYGDATSQIQGCKGWGFESPTNWNDSTTTWWVYTKCDWANARCYWTAICTDGYFPDDQCSSHSDCYTDITPYSASQSS